VWDNREFGVFVLFPSVCVVPICLCCWGLLGFVGVYGAISLTSSEWMGHVIELCW
jgi:hypothetical protein